MTATANMPELTEMLSRDLDYICAKAADELGKLAGRQVWFTGGAGFLGYYTAHAIAHWNAAREATGQIGLTILDNLIRGKPAWLEDIEGDWVTCREVDVAKGIPDDLPPPDYIIHGASIASPIYYRKYPLETIDANVDGLRNVLDYAAARPGAVRGVLFFSTSEIYGDPPASEIPTAETFRGLVSSTGPRACYDESKRLGETLCVVFAQQSGVPVAMARPFNNYGPGLSIEDGRVLPDFARNVLSGKDIVMHSDGSPTRTFCYVADAIVGYFKVLTRGRPGEPYNIGIEKPEISMRQLADLVASIGREFWDYSGKVISQPSKEAAYLADNPNRRCPDISKARAELSYTPEIGIEDGVRRALTWYYHTWSNGSD